IGDNAGSIGVSISPNPNQGNFALSVSTQGIEKLGIRISAANGAVTYERSDIESNGLYTEALQLNLAQGTYNITVSTSNGFVVKKFVVTK
ncbi:MAG: T9SS type A sorting domain-containing protein, partial [Bacteroidales bacterium]